MLPKNFLVILMDSKEDIEQRLAFIKKRLLTLDWDKKLNQLHDGMEPKLTEYKKELADLEQKLKDSSAKKEVVISA